MTTFINTKIRVFADVLEAALRNRYLQNYPDLSSTVDDVCKVTIWPGRKFTRVDVGGINHCGRYMVDNVTGIIYGIKAYGVVHRGRTYGTLDTIDDWDWSGYRAVKK